MKVCMVSGTFPGMRCGVGDYTYWLSKELKNRGIELSIITTDAPQVSGKSSFNINPVIKKWGFSELLLLVRKIRQGAPDIVHLQYPTQAYKNKIMINIFPIIFKLTSKIPLIVTIHDAKTAHLLNKIRLIPFVFFAKRIIVTAEEEREYFIKRSPFFKSKFQLIYIGANIECYQFSEAQRKEFRKNSEVKENEILIVHFGYLLKKKRLEVIFYSLRDLLRRGYRVKLAMLSEFNPKENKYHVYLDRLTSKLNLNKNVIWTGYLGPEDVSKFLSSSDICVEVYQDGVSFRRGSFLASLSHGLPIVTTKVKKLPQGLKEFQNIVAVPVNHLERLAEYVKELIDYPQLRRKIGENAKDFSKRFSWEDIALKHIELYNEIQKDTLN